MQSPVQFGLIDVAYSTCDIFCIFEIQILYSTLARMVRYWSIGFGFFFLCKPCKLIFLAKEMEKPQLCYQINKNIGNNIDVDPKYYFSSKPAQHV